MIALSTYAISLSLSPYIYIYNTHDNWTYNQHHTVSFHNFKSQNFKLSVSNPKSKHVAYVSVLSQISNCQGLGRKNKHEILKTDRTLTSACWLSDQTSGSAIRDDESARRLRGILAREISYLCARKHNSCAVCMEQTIIHTPSYTYNSYIIINIT